MHKRTLPIIASVLASASLLTALLLLLGGGPARAAPTTTDTIGRPALGVELSPGYHKVADPGSVVTYTHTLTNTAPLATDVHLAATNSHDWTITLPISLEVSGGPTGTFTVSVVVPHAASANITARTFITATAFVGLDTYIDTVTDTTFVREVTWYVYLPLVMRDYRPFVNGGFDNGLNGWNTGQGPFNGHGGGVPQRVTLLGGDNRALLGDPEMADGSIPVGYGYIAQTFTVDKPHLQLQYQVVSYDIVTGTQPYFDTFEVSVDRSPDQIQNADRDSAVFNPSGVDLPVSTDGLVFYSGRSGTTSDVGTRWESGWMTVTLDLSDLQGENITLYLSIWSREYRSPYYDDRGWYNTWAVVDNLVLQD
jgi:hypothetical protein